MSESIEIYTVSTNDMFGARETCRMETSLWSRVTMRSLNDLSTQWSPGKSSSQIHSFEADLFSRPTDPDRPPILTPHKGSLCIPLSCKLTLYVHHCLCRRQGSSEHCRRSVKVLLVDLCTARILPFAPLHFSYLTSTLSVPLKS